MLDQATAQGAYLGHLGAPVLREVDVTIHILSDRRLQLRIPAAAAASAASFNP